MSISQGSLQQTRELLKNERFNREQLEALARNNGLCGELPSPSGSKDGESYWSKSSVIEWSEKTKRSRSGPVEMATRSFQTIESKEQRKR